MKNNILAVSVLAIIGIIFLAGGAAASVYTISNTVRCEVCGMAMNKNSITTVRVVTPDGVTHWACDPLCAAEEAIYYQTCTIEGKCCISGRSIQIDVANGSVVSATVTPSSPQDDVSVVVSGNSMADYKFVSTQAYADQLMQKYSTHATDTDFTLPQILAMGANMFMGTPSYKPVQISAIDYALLIVGISLICADSVSWKLLKKSNAET
jgi:hypothetical protein